MPNSKATAKPTVLRRRRSTSAKSGHQAHWFDASAAHAHLQHLDRELARLKDERELILHVLGRPAGAVSLAGPQPVRARPGRRPSNGGPSMLDLLERIISQGSAGKGWTVGELREELVRLDPARAAVGNASSLISSALVQALRAKRPRFTGSKAGRGHARKYRLAAARE